MLGARVAGDRDHAVFASDVRHEGELVHIVGRVSRNRRPHGPCRAMTFRTSDVRRIDLLEAA